MRESTAWRIQAKSDVDAARKLAGKHARPSAYCQVAAKAQQSIEKSVKALQAALHHAGPYGSAVGSAHQVLRVASAIRAGAPTWPKAVKSQRDRVTSILSDGRLKTIKELDNLVPQYPARGELPRRNTEYPFQEQAGAHTWKAPAEEGAFAKKEIDGFLLCAQHFQNEIDKVVTALELAYP